MKLEFALWCLHVVLVLARLSEDGSASVGPHTAPSVSLFGLEASCGAQARAVSIGHSVRLPRPGGRRLAASRGGSGGAALVGGVPLALLPGSLGLPRCARVRRVPLSLGAVARARRRRESVSSQDRARRPAPAFSGAPPMLVRSASGDELRPLHTRRAARALVARECVSLAPVEGQRLGSRTPPSLVRPREVVDTRRMELS